MKNNLMKRLIPLLLCICISLLCIGCGMTNGEPPSDEMIYDNYPYEPDKPEPPPHEGVFTSEYGTMTFRGDGETVELDFQDELSRLSGVPAGQHSGTYVFMSGPMAPPGSIPFRYDNAWSVVIEVEGQSYEIELGLVNADGGVSVGVDTVTEERIPFLFTLDEGDRNDVFLKQ